MTPAPSYFLSFCKFCCLATLFCVHCVRPGGGFIVYVRKVLVARIHCFHFEIYSLCVKFLGCGISERLRPSL